MALQGTIPNPFRVSGDIENAYAKITRLEFNYLARQASMHVYIFNSVEDRDGDNPATPVSNASYVLTGDDFNTYFADSVLAEDGTTTLGQAYAYLKTLPEWSEWDNC